MLAIHRAAPAIEQYQRDLQPLTESPELIDALWDLAMAGGWRIATKGKEGIGPKQIDEMRAAAPTTFEFLQRTGQLLQGILPGFNSAVIDVGARPAIAERAALPPPDAELVRK